VVGEMVPVVKLHLFFNLSRLFKFVSFSIFYIC